IVVALPSAMHAEQLAAVIRQGWRRGAFRAVTELFIAGPRCAIERRVQQVAIATLSSMGAQESVGHFVLLTIRSYSPLAPIREVRMGVLTSETNPRRPRQRIP